MISREAHNGGQRVSHRAVFAAKCQYIVMHINYKHIGLDPKVTVDIMSSASSIHPTSKIELGPNNVSSDPV